MNNLHAVEMRKIRYQILQESTSKIVVFPFVGQVFERQQRDANRLVI